MTDREEQKNAYDRVAYGVNHQDLEVIGEHTVMSELNTGKYGSPGHKAHAYVSDWLAQKTLLREVEAISIAKAANTIDLAAATLASEANAIARRDKKRSFIETIISFAIAIKTAIWR